MKYSDFRRIATVASSAALLAAGVGFADPASATRIKCWTNDDGVRECGNVVPPKYAQQSHREINSQGVTVATSRRAKTEEELAEEARREHEAQAQATEHAEREREQAARDRVLLDTFTTEDDLVLAHRGRVAAIESRVKHTRQIVGVLEEDLSRLQQEAAKQERSGNPIPADLDEKLVGTRRQISEHVSFMANRNQEKVDLHDQFEQDLSRYRELKGERR